MLSLICASIIHHGGQFPLGLTVHNSDGQGSISLSDGTLLHRGAGRIQGQRMISIPGSQEVAVWHERTSSGTTPYYAVLDDQGKVLRVTDTSYTVKLRFAEFDPAIAVPTVAPNLKANTDNQIYIVQFQAQPLQGMRDAIEAAGGTIYYFLAQHSYLVKLDATARDRVASMPFVRWVGPYQPAYRLDPDLLAKLQGGTLARQRYNLQVFRSGLEQKQRLAALIQKLGGTPLDVTEWGYVMQADLTAEQLKQALSSNDLFWVDKHSDYQPDMDIVRQMSGANYVEQVGGYAGQGVRGQVRDIGVRQTHVDFASRPLMMRSNTSDGSHGTCTTGIIFGDGTGNAQGRGMLPQGQGIFIAGLPANSQRYSETAALLQAPYFGCFESNSTGTTQTTQYTTDSFGMDDILFHMNVLICQSQSNLGNQNSRPQAWAKNIVSVGGVYHFNTLTKTDDHWNSGASIGPAADGRIKPDLCDVYDQVFTTYYTADNAYTTNFNGTSAATPIVCGHFGLLFQMWADGIFGQTVTGATVFDARPHWETMKALMINTASQYPFSGTTADLTRTHQGWGMPDLQSAYDQRNGTFIVDNSDALQNLQVRTYRLFVPAGVPALRATMVYKDPAGTTSSTQHRINDLTLKVTDPTGATFYYGNNGLLAGNWSTPGGTANTKDTVENVFVQNPTSGVWILEVQANEVNVDSHLDTPEVDADYSLVVTGAATAILPSSFSTGPASLLSGGLSELVTSNNHRMVLGPALVIGAGSDPGPDLTVTGVSPTTSLSALRFRVESSVSIRGQMTVSLFDYSAQTYVPVATSVAGTLSDSVIEPVVTDNPSRFVNPATNEVKAKIHWDVLRLNGSEHPTELVDQVRWLITP